MSSQDIPTDGSTSEGVVSSKPEDNVHVQSEPEYPGPIKLTLIMTAVLLAIFLGSIDQTIVATAIPRITDEFHGLDKVTWYGSAYFLTYAGFMSCWGKALQNFSVKYSFLIAILLFEVGSLICAVAPSANVLIGGRIVSGIGCSGIAIGAFLSISLASRPDKRPMLFSMFSTVYAVGAVLGPLLGGAFTGGSAGWRWCFWINLPIGGVAAVLTVFVLDVQVHKSKDEKLTFWQKVHDLDLGGALLLMGALCAFVLAVQYGGQRMPWSSSTVIGLLVGSVAIGATFVAWQAYLGDSAMIVSRVLLTPGRAVWTGAVFQMLYAGAYFTTLYYLPIYFQSVDNASPLGSGVRNLPLVVSLGVASIAFSPVIAIVSRSGPFMFAGGVLSAVGSGLFYTLDEGSSTGAWIGYQILGGIAWGGPFQCAMIGAQASLSPVDMSEASTIIILAQTLGGTLGSSAAQCAFDNKLVNVVASLRPDIPASLVLSTGATEIRSVFSADDLPVIIHAYVESLRYVWILTSSMCAFATLVTFLTPWHRLYPKKAKEVEDAQPTDELKGPKEPAKVE